MIALLNPKRIVAEVTRNWKGDENDVMTAQILATRFEKVIERNRERGYALEDWKLTSHMTNDLVVGWVLTETIVAVFVQLQPDE